MTNLFKVEISDKECNNNIFTECAFAYYNYISRCKKDCNDRKSIIRSKGKDWIVNEKGEEVSLPIYQTAEMIEYLNNTLNTLKTNNLEDFFFTIKEFAHFLIVAKKCFFYHNFDYSPIYSEEKEDSIILHISLDNLNTQITYTFRSTDINLSKSETLLNYINNGEENNITNSIIILDLDIERVDGDKECAKFMINVPNSISVEDNIDKMMLNNVFHITTDMIFDTFFDILNNYVSKCITKCNEDTRITIEEVLKWSMVMGTPLNYLYEDI